MAISLEFFYLTGNTAFIQPPFWFKLMGILAPDTLGSMDSKDGNGDELTCSNGNMVDGLIIGGLDRDAQWDYIVFRGLKTPILMLQAMKR